MREEEEEEEEEEMRRRRRRGGEEAHSPHDESIDVVIPVHVAKLEIPAERDNWCQGHTSPI